MGNCLYKEPISDVSKYERTLIAIDLVAIVSNDKHLKTIKDVDLEHILESSESPWNSAELSELSKDMYQGHQRGTFEKSLRTIKSISETYL